MKYDVLQPGMILKYEKHNDIRSVLFCGNHIFITLEKDNVNGNVDLTIMRTQAIEYVRTDQFEDSLFVWSDMYKKTALGEPGSSRYFKYYHTLITTLFEWK